MTTINQPGKTSFSGCMDHQENTNEKNDIKVNRNKMRKRSPVYLEHAFPALKKIIQLQILLKTGSDLGYMQRKST